MARSVDFRPEVDVGHNGGGLICMKRAKRFQVMARLMRVMALQVWLAAIAISTAPAATAPTIAVGAAIAIGASRPRSRLA